MSRRKRLLESLERDIQEHIEAETQDGIARGLSEADARSAALRKFGNITLVKEDTRAVWNPAWVEQFLQDVRYGIRMLRRNPGFTAVSILTLAVGIGMNAAMFSAINALLLRPLRYPNAERLIWLSNYNPSCLSADCFVSRADYLVWKAQAHSFEDMTAYGNLDLALQYENNSDTERIASVAGDFWKITGARAQLGSLFKPGDPNTIVLSWPLFKKRFAGDPQLVGKVVNVNGHAFTVTGVLPQTFRMLFPQELQTGDELRTIGAYISLPNSHEALGDPIKENPALGPAPPWIRVVGKLKPGISLTQAHAEMQIIFRRVLKYPNAYSHSPGTTLHFMPLKEKIDSGVRPALTVLFGAVAFLLLIAITNVANLLLARSLTREREIAIRAAIGAGRMRLVRQLLVESLLLSICGGAAGLLVAEGVLAAIRRFGLEGVPRLTDASLDARVLAYTFFVAAFTGVLFGLAPAFWSWRSSPHEALKIDGKTSSASRGKLRLRGLLVAAEVSLAIVLLTGAGLMLKSFRRMTSYPPGFTPKQVLVMKVPLTGPLYFRNWPHQAAYLRELFNRIQRIPGVQAFGIDCGRLNQPVSVEGIAMNPTGVQPVAALRMVSPGYLQALGAPLLQGHWPTETEALDSVLVNQALVSQTREKTGILGRHIRGSFLNATIVGVVADFKDRQLDISSSPEVYVPYQMAPMVNAIRLAIRISGDTSRTESTVQKLVSGIDRSVPIDRLETLEQELSDSIAPRRFNLFLLLVFAGVAVLLALIGIYGSMAYFVTQRTQEIGIRMALGARRAEIVHMIVLQGMKLTLAGIAFGLVAAFLLTQLMGSMLYGVNADDPRTYAAVVLLLALMALLACGVPGWKASLIAPLEALRHE